MSTIPKLGLERLYHGLPSCGVIPIALNEKLFRKGGSPYATMNMGTKKREKSKKGYGGFG